MATMDLFVGGRLEGLTVLGGTVQESTNGYNNSYADCAIHAPGSSSFTHPFCGLDANPYTVTAGNYVMTHAVTYLDSANGNGVILALTDSTGRPTIGIMASGGLISLQHNTGTAAAPNWVQLGTGTASTGILGSPTPLDLQVVIAAGGNHTATLFANGNQIQQSTFADAAITSGGISGAWYGGDGYADSYFSELYSRLNGSTVGAHVKTVRATGPGTHVDWTGAYTDVNEQVTNDSTANQSTNAGDKQSYPMGNVTVPTGYSISSIWNWIRVKNDGNAPANVKSLIISGATEQESGNLPGVGLGFSGVGQRYDNDPATSAPWTQAAINAPVQLGYQSAA